LQHEICNTKTVMPGLGPGIHVFLLRAIATSQDVDGRDKPGHDELFGLNARDDLL
jgi:hypothetical protein